MTGRDRPAISRRGVLAGLGAASLGFPHIARADAKPIRVAMSTILSGRVATLGVTTRAGAQLVFDAVNAAGGVAGRPIELICRDSEGKPDVAAKLVRDMINNDGCEIVLDGESSAAAFAVHEVARDIPVLCIHAISETSSLTADPKQFIKTAFRSARQGIHDAVAGGLYAAKLVKERDLKRWMTCSPDYAFGRDNTARFIEFARKFEPSIEVVDQTWPKLFAPDYTEAVTKVLSAQPQALYSSLWGGDLVAFVEQANLYQLFAGTAFFSSSLGDTPVLSAIHNLPPGLYSAYRYSRQYPSSPANTGFADAFDKRVGYDPTNWAWQSHLGATFIVEALKRTGGRADGAALAAEIAGMTVPSPIGVNGTITMRAADHTIVDYPTAWSQTVTAAPYLADFVPVPWPRILELEADWKKANGYT